MTGGYVKLYRSIESWEWYTDSNTKSLFLHCLVRSNHTTKKWRGTVIEPGSFVTSLESLSVETGLSIRSIRTSLRRLEETGEILRKTTNRFTVLYVVKWADYQGQDDDDDKQTTNKRQTNDKQTTTNKNDKNEKNEKNNTKDIGVFDKYCGDNVRLLTALYDFEAMRKATKKPMTDRAKELLVAKLSKMSGDPIDILNQSIVKNWSDVYPLKEQYQQRVEQIPDYTQDKPSMSQEDIDKLKERLRRT